MPTIDTPNRLPDIDDATVEKALPLIRYYAREYNHDRPDLADDVVQEAALLLLTRPDRRPGSSLEGWAMIVTRKVSSRAVRRYGRQKFDIDRLRQAGRRRTPATPPETIRAAEVVRLSAAVRERLAGVRHPDLPAFLRVHLDGECSASVARDLGLRLSTLRQRFTNLKPILARRLAGPDAEALLGDAVTPDDLPAGWATTAELARETGEKGKAIGGLFRFRNVRGMDYGHKLYIHRASFLRYLAVQRSREQMAAVGVEWMTVKAAAARLGVSRVAVQLYVKNGTLARSITTPRRGLAVGMRYVLRAEVEALAARRGRLAAC